MHIEMATKQSELLTEGLKQTIQEKNHKNLSVGHTKENEHLWFSQSDQTQAGSDAPFSLQNNGFQLSMEKSPETGNIV